MIRATPKFINSNIKLISGKIKLEKYLKVGHAINQIIFSKK